MEKLPPRHLWRRKVAFNTRRGISRSACDRHSPSFGGINSSSASRSGQPGFLTCRRWAEAHEVLYSCVTSRSQNEMAPARLFGEFGIVESTALNQSWDHGMRANESVRYGGEMPECGNTRAEGLMIIRRQGRGLLSSGSSVFF